ncbi:peptide-methionine (S)-S-oxide reductase MsrA [Colwellia sp. MEBiC06753]
MRVKIVATNQQIATLAGGCFWCIEAAYNQLKGINSAVSGYMGGTEADANYKRVCDGDTDHAEVVQLSFNADEISYREILEIFFTLHDPTQLNRQGNDIGRQYRSAIFCHDQEQLATANAIIAELTQDKVWPEPIVTEVTEALPFYSGEQYHQGYFNANPENQYCQAVVSPKLAKFRKNFVDRLK